MLRFLGTAVACLALSACTNVLSVTDTSGAHYATLRGTVTRSNGTPVPNVAIGISCVGSSNEPFGLTADANASGAFEADITAPGFFAPLPGPTYICRVLTPVVGVPQAERSITLTVSADFRSKPVNTVTLVVP
jgi:hypothetical protein